MEFRVAVHTEETYGYLLDPIASFELIESFELEDIELNAFSPIHGHYTYVAYQEYAVEVDNWKELVEQVSKVFSQVLQKYPNESCVLAVERLENNKWEEYVAITRSVWSDNNEFAVHDLLHEFQTTYTTELNGGI